MEIWYTCRYKLDPTDPVSWASFTEWANIPQLQELLSLDIHLCRNAIEDLTAEDWQHNVQEHFLILYFRDLPYLMERTQYLREKTHLFAVCLEPLMDARQVWSDPHFEFVGYDLLDDVASVSVLTNCKGFEQVIDPSLLSTSGLLTEYALAERIQQQLREVYSLESHSDSEIWAVWKYVGNSVVQSSNSVR